MDPVTRRLPGEEETWIKKASKGDLDAFNQLVIRYQNMAYQRAYSFVWEHETAEDITQESFIKAFRSIRKFRGGSFRSWLLKIVTNTAYDFLRQAKKHPVQPLLAEDEPSDAVEIPPWIGHTSTSVESTVEQNEVSQYLAQLLDELPDTHRSVITLVDIYELDYTEAAELLNVPLGTVKSRLARARLQMKKKLMNDARYSYQFQQSMALAQS